MNEQNNQPTQSTNTPTPQAVIPEQHPRHHMDWFWALVLVIMGAFLAYGFFTAYMRSKNMIQPIYNSQNTMEYAVPEAELMPSEDTTVMEDQSKDTSQINEEILVEIDEVENSDIDAELDSSQMSDLKE